MRNFFLLIILMACAAGTSPAEEAYSPREKLILMKERISRDLEKAQELRSQAMLQKGRLEGIIQKANEGSRDPNADPEVYEKVLAAAPARLQQAEETLAKTETTIRDLNLKLVWVKRALDNLSAGHPIVRKEDAYLELEIAYYQLSSDDQQVVKHAREVISLATKWLKESEAKNVLNEGRMQTGEGMQIIPTSSSAQPVQRIPIIIETPLANEFRSLDRKRGEAAVVSSIKGTLYKETPSGWIPFTGSVPLLLGDRIKAGSGSEVLIRRPDGKEIILRSEEEFSFTERPSTIWDDLDRCLEDKDPNCMRKPKRSADAPVSIRG